MKFLDPEKGLGKSFCSVIDPGTALLAGSALSAGGSIFSGIFGASAAKQQGKAIEEAARIASQTALTLDDRARKDVAPFREYGIKSGDSLMDLLFGGGDIGSKLEASPLYQFQSEIGTRDINRQLSARGMYGSGKGLETLAMFTKGLAAEEGQRYYDRLFNTTTLGANAAARMATNTTQTGNTLAGIQAQTGIAGANAIANQYNAIGGIGPGVAGAFRGYVGDTLMYDMFNKVFGAPGRSGAVEMDFDPSVFN